ncbi:hypothetical protein [Paenacidovorax monticola]|uniref:Uncharacterized protein n=1 Tax=Paenacidovorax monticola TaxID=1926868 RepID=A0A7H0HHL2_9BURK|nr:hypothetical protein [Paenacidovorax monticola]QNP60028.1 hypothetical protein H9L24_03580 [Paenacidovorax monticola]
MRQADMKAAGCELKLPPSRTQTTIPGQKIWLDAGRMLWQLAGGNEAEGLPRRAQVLEVLQELSKDDFLQVKSNPPLLYHNDFSATVRRLYWAEDVGYAIWLRLYLESQRTGLLADKGQGSDVATVALRGRKAP